MGKLYLLLLAFFCISQNLGITIATSPEEQSSINNIVEIVNELTTEIKQIVDGLSNRLPEVIKTIETKVKRYVEKVNIALIFESAHEAIDKLMRDPFITSDCSDEALEKIEELYESTKADINTCVLQAQAKRQDIQTAVGGLMDKAGQLAKDMTKKIKECGDQFGTDAVGLSTCMTEGVTEFKSMLGQLKDVIEETMSVAENMASEIAFDAGTCLREVRGLAWDDTEEVIRKLSKCKIHEEL